MAHSAQSEGNSSFLSPGGFEFNFFTLWFNWRSPTAILSAVFYPVLQGDTRSSVQGLGQLHAHHHYILSHGAQNIWGQPAPSSLQLILEGRMGIAQVSVVPAYLSRTSWQHSTWGRQKEKSDCFQLPSFSLIDWIKWSRKREVYEHLTFLV